MFKSSGSLFLYFFLFLFNVSTKFSLLISDSISKCDSKIYCTGKLLHTIQMSFVFNDSKTFVDMPSKQSEEIVVQNFVKLGISPNKTQIETFLNENFFAAGYDLVQTLPVDWTEAPPYLNFLNQNDLQLINMGKKLNIEWKSLLRKFEKEKLCQKCVSSSISTNNSFIVPGGRFIEYYYWDSYWVYITLISILLQTLINRI
jgi:alpha,alpha-trehalase